MTGHWRIAFLVAALIGLSIGAWLSWRPQAPAAQEKKAPAAPVALLVVSTLHGKVIPANWLLMPQDVSIELDGIGANRDMGSITVQSKAMKDAERDYRRRNPPAHL